MPTYEFEAENGTVIERFYHMAEAPPLGSTIEEEGKTYTRRLERHQTRIVSDCEFTSRQINPRHPALLARKRGFKIGKYGQPQPIFTGNRDAARFEDDCRRVAEQENKQTHQEPTTPVYKHRAM